MSIKYLEKKYGSKRLDRIKRKLWEKYKDKYWMESISYIKDKVFGIEQIIITACCDIGIDMLKDKIAKGVKVCVIRKYTCLDYPWYLAI